MPYSNRIKTLEESYRLVDTQIESLNKLGGDQEKIKKLTEFKNKYLIELRDLRRAQYEHTQIIDFGDDR